MRGLLIGVVLAVFGPMAVLVLERIMSRVPQWIWGLAAWACVGAAVLIVCISDPVYPDVKNHPKIAAMVVLIVLAASGFVFLKVGWPFRHLENTSNRIETRQKFLIDRLRDFISEANYIHRQGWGARMGLTFTFHGEVIHFLKLHFNDWYVERFEENGKYALEEIIKELLSGDPIREVPKREIVLIAPQEPHRYEWLPLQNVSIVQGTSLPRDLGVPTFRLKNLSNVLVTDIRVTWRVDESRSIGEVFLNSECFKRYGAIYDRNGLAPFRLTNKHMTVGLSASDEEIQDIPSLAPPTAEQEGFRVPMPTPMACGYALRIAATLQRPDETKEPERRDKTLKATGPSIEVLLEYQAKDIHYKRRFKIDSTICVISETVFDAGFGGNIASHFWSPDNLRAMATFSVIPIKPPFLL